MWNPHGHAMCHSTAGVSKNVKFRLSRNPTKFDGATRFCETKSTMKSVPNVGTDTHGQRKSGTSTNPSGTGTGTDQSDTSTDASTSPDFCTLALLSPNSYIDGIGTLIMTNGGSNKNETKRKTHRTRRLDEAKC